MFKELKVLKLVIAFAVLLLILFSINYDKYSGVLIYIEKPTFLSGEDVRIGVVSYKDNSANLILNISDWKGHEIARKEMKTGVIPQSKWDIFRNGPSSHNYHIILPSAVPNLYLINDSIPVVVTSTQPCDITVVLPQSGQLLIQRFFGWNAIDSIQQPIWKNRPLALDEKTKQLLQWLSENYANKTIQFVSDLTDDFEHVFEQSKVVLVYGYNKFVSTQYHQALAAYWFSGGSLLFISSYYPQYQLDVMEKQVKLAIDAEANLKSLDNKFVPFSYLLGGYPVTAEFTKVINRKNWPEKIPFFANGVPISGGGNTLAYDMPIESSYSANKVSGIGYYDRMISIPTDEWLSPNNFNKEEVRTLTKLLLDELLEQ
jgi:hypothetical protein